MDVNAAKSGKNTTLLSHQELFSSFHRTFPFGQGSQLLGVSFEFVVVAGF